jgi:hypothetical protein
MKTEKEYREKAQAAYMAGKTELVELCDELADALERIEEWEDVETLAHWEKKNGPANLYKKFFYDCFDRLHAHYPAPSITSDHDQSVIFEAIDKGEA